MNVDTDYLESLLSEAEELAIRYPACSIANSGKALELGITSYLEEQEGIEKYMDLIEKIEHPIVSRALSHKGDYAHLIRQARNAAAHTPEDFTTEQASLTANACRELLSCFYAALSSTPQLENGNKSTPSKSVSFDQRIVYPPSITAQQLEPGEVFLLSFLDRELDENWQIFVQPYILGKRPDFLLLNPNNKIIHIEVKDTDYSSYQFTEKGLFIDSNAKHNNLRQNPVLQLNLMRNVLLTGPLAELALDGSLYKPVISILYLHNTATTFANSLFTNPFSIAITRDFLVSRGIEAIVTRKIDTILVKKPSFQNSVNHLKRWLLAPSFEGLPLEAKGKQKLRSKSKWQSDDLKVLEKQVIELWKAPPGAGKTALLCLRARNAERQQKHVLLTCYNITMVNRLASELRRCTNKLEREHITIRHVDSLPFEILASEGKLSSHSELDSFGDHILRGTVELIASNNFTFNRFDSIFIDESQDMSPSRLNFFYSICSDNGEMIFTTDSRQDIYKRFKKDELSFKYTTREIGGISKRVPSKLAKWLNEFDSLAQIGEVDELPLFVEQGELLLSKDNEMIWQNFENDGTMIDAIPEVIRKYGGQCHPSDWVVLTRSEDIGKKVVGRICNASGNSNNSVIHTFGDLRESVEEAEVDRGKAISIKRKQKYAFYSMTGRYKVTTIHSFKGWESRKVIVVWHRGNTNHDSMKNLLYVAASRATEQIIILTSDSHILRYFSNDWQDITE
ncbi:MAG: ATP-binding domain-containing protein [Fimbriimonadaceae bacterium]